MTMQEQIEKKLISAFEPIHLEVINESQLHAGHAGDDGSGESHFRLAIQSKSFDGVSRVMRERMIYQALEEEMKHIHALSMSVKPQLD